MRFVCDRTPVKKWTGETLGWEEGEGGTERPALATALFYNRC